MYTIPPKIFQKFILGASWDPFWNYFGASWVPEKLDCGLKIVLKYVLFK